MRQFLKMKNQLRKKLVTIGLLLLWTPLCCLADETVTVYKANNVVYEAFILFYMASCAHCRHFEPVLKDYADTHHIPILTYTLDGNMLSGFPKSMTPTQDEIKHFFPDANPVVPALFLMDFNQHKIIPVLKGEASIEQLSNRMEDIHAMSSQDEKNEV